MEAAMQVLLTDDFAVYRTDVFHDLRPLQSMKARTKTVCGLGRSPWRVELLPVGSDKHDLTKLSYSACRSSTSMTLNCLRFKLSVIRFNFSVSTSSGRVNKVR